MQYDFCESVWKLPAVSITHILLLQETTYPKSSIKPLGGLFNFGSSKGELIREGGLFTKSSDWDTFDSFPVLLPHILRNQLMILRLKYINSTQFLSQTILK